MSNIRALTTLLSLQLLSLAIILHTLSLTVRYRDMEANLSSDDHVVLLKGDVSLEHIKQQYTEGPDSGAWYSMVAVTGQPFWWTVHSIVPNGRNYSHFRSYTNGSSYKLWVG